jgi:hypothetical protein
MLLNGSTRGSQVISALARTLRWRGLLSCLLVGVTLAVNAQVGNQWNSIGPPGGTVSSLLSSPMSSTTLYAGTPENGVFISTDAGQTWAAGNAGLTPTTAFGRQTLRVVYALVDDGQYVYAATASGIFYTPAGTAPNWAPLADTGSATPITFLAFDSNFKRLYAASNGSDGLSPPHVYVTDLDTAISAPLANWSTASLPLPADALPVAALSLVPPTANLQGVLFVSAGGSLFGAPLLSNTSALSWYATDQLPTGPITTLAYSADYLQAYACSGGTIVASGNPADAAPLWSPLDVVPSSAAGFNCSSFFALSSSAAGGSAPQVLLGTDQGAFVLGAGPNGATVFQATGALRGSPAANSFAVANSSMSNEAIAFTGGGFGVHSATVSSLGLSAAWSPSNGPASVASGGSNARLNNANVVDTAVIGTQLFAAATSNSYSEVFVSTDQGATWSPTGVHSALGNFDTVEMLIADASNRVLYAGTSQGLYAYSASAGQWNPVGSLGPVASMALGSGTLFVGTDTNVYVVPLSASPASATPTRAAVTALDVKALHVAGNKLYVASFDGVENYIVSSAPTADVVAGRASWLQVGGSPAGRDRITSLLQVGDILLAGTNGGLVLYSSSTSNWAVANPSDPAFRIDDPFGVVNSLYSDGVSIYAATGSNGVYVSPVVGGFFWSPLNGSGDSALPSLEVHSLHGVGTTLFAGTRGGIATADGLSSPSTPPSPTPSGGAGGGGGAVAPGFALLLMMAVWMLRRNDSGKPRNRTSLRTRTRDH